MLNMIRLKNISIECFSKERLNKEEEVVRKFILQKIRKAENKPEKYNEFCWFIPEGGNYKYISDMIEDAKENKGHIATDVELGLIWAELLSNKKVSWAEMCREPDCSTNFRLFQVEKGYRLLGGSTKNGCTDLPRTDIDKTLFRADDYLPDTVPIIVI